MSEAQFTWINDVWVSEEDRPIKHSSWAPAQLAEAWRVLEIFGMHFTRSLDANLDAVYRVMAPQRLRTEDDEWLPSPDITSLQMTGSASVSVSATGGSVSVSTLDRQSGGLVVYTTHSAGSIAGGHGSMVGYSTHGVSRLDSRAKRLLWRLATGSGEIYHRYHRRPPSQVSYLYERRINAFERKLEEQSRDKELSQTAEKHKLISALMDDDWLGLRLLATIGESGSGMTITGLVKAVDRHADRVAPMLAALSRYGVVEVTGTTFLLSPRGSDILASLVVALEAQGRSSRP
jgi:hypothetical protein